MRTWSADRWVALASLTVAVWLWVSLLLMAQDAPAALLVGHAAGIALIGTANAWALGRPPPTLPPDRGPKDDSGKYPRISDAR